MSKRKSMKEIRLEEFCDGFYQCLCIFEELHRNEFWKEYHKRSQLGLSTLTGECQTPKSKITWEGIEKAQKKIRDKEKEYKDLLLERISNRN